MKKTLRIAFTVSMCAAMTLGITSLVSAGGGKSHPAPPPPVLCGCACPDGSIAIVHAENEAGCPAACANACSQES